MSGKVKVGVVGLGMGWGHAKGYREQPNVELAALCDLDENRLAAAAKEFGVTKTFRNAEEMYAKAGLDAVSIATPNKFHAPLTIAALGAGLHVLCEKPMAMNVAEALAMKAAAKKAGRNLMINFSYRFDSMSQALKQQVDAGLLGKVYFGRTVWHRRRGMPQFGGWFGLKEMSGGGPLIDLGVHRLDLALWLMGFPRAVTVSGCAYDLLARERSAREGKPYTVEDLSAALIRLDNGATLIVEASWALNIAESESMTTTLCGTKGGLVQRNTDGGYSFTAEMYTEEDGFQYTKKLDRVGRKVPSAYQEFISSIVEKRQPMATADHGIQVTRILDAIYRSAAAGHEVRIEDDDDMPTAGAGKKRPAGARAAAR